MGREESGQRHENRVILNLCVLTLACLRCRLNGCQEIGPTRASLIADGTPETPTFTHYALVQYRWEAPSMAEADDPRDRAPQPRGWSTVLGPGAGENRSRSGSRSRLRSGSGYNPLGQSRQGTTSISRRSSATGCGTISARWTSDRGSASVPEIDQSCRRFFTHAASRWRRADSGRRGWRAPAGGAARAPRLADHTGRRRRMYGARAGLSPRR